MDDENSGESPLISIWGEYTGLYSLYTDQCVLGTVIQAQACNELYYVCG